MRGYRRGRLAAALPCIRELSIYDDRRPRHRRRVRVLRDGFLDGTNLRVLRATGLPRYDLLYLARDAAARSLVSLDVSGCDGLTDGVLERLAANLPALRRLRFRSCANVTSRGFLGALRAPFLEELDASRNRLSRPLPADARLEVPAALRSLRLRACHLNVDLTVAVLVLCAPALRTTDLSECHPPSTRLIEAACAAGSGLRKLGLACWHELRDFSFLARVPRLKMLDLAGCWGFDAARAERLHHLPELRTLDLSCCTVSDDTKRRALLALRTSGASIVVTEKTADCGAAVLGRLVGSSPSMDYRKQTLPVGAIVEGTFHWRDGKALLRIECATRHLNGLS